VTDITTDVTLVTCGRHLKHIDYFIMNIRYICPDVRYTIANPLRGGGWVELVVVAWYSTIRSDKCLVNENTVGWSADQWRGR